MASTAKRSPSTTRTSKRTVRKIANRNKFILMRADSPNLRVHPTAQRALNQARLKKMYDEFTFEGLGTLHVVHYEIDGVLAYWIVDGHHRHVTVLAHNFGEWEVMVEVHTKVKDDAAASKLFRQLNARAIVPQHDLFNNLVKEAIGENPSPEAIIAFEADALVHSHGFEMQKYHKTGTISSPKAIMQAWKVDEGVSFDKVLTIVVGTQGKEPAGTEGDVLVNLTRFIHEFEDDIDLGYLTRRLAKYPGQFAGLIGNVRGLRAVRRDATFAKCFREIMLDLYNSGKRKGRLGE
jgi:hypothetical protein